ncbi:hypothetical protein TNCV_5084471 [Trichonephila clavipes]|uniref:Uncharacterized protein n=1 Tax=Trichonephila clavipes TaxID=2585209 RepID=A0A8X6S9N8_TRICX|nr:hypothetical protein TNCV_5084471 [Trichonephila clavipes]
MIRFGCLLTSHSEANLPLKPRPNFQTILKPLTDGLNQVIRNHQNSPGSPPVGPGKRERTVLERQVRESMNGRPPSDSAFISLRNDLCGLYFTNRGTYLHKYYHRLRATRGLSATDLVILNHGQVTRTTPEQAPLSQLPLQWEDV